MPVRKRKAKPKAKKLSNAQVARAKEVSKTWAKNRRRQKRMDTWGANMRKAIRSRKR